MGETLLFRGRSSSYWLMLSGYRSAAKRSLVSPLERLTEDFILCVDCLSLSGPA